MPSKVDQGTLIILDIGRNVAEPDEKNGKSFFEAARECTARLIERKIMSQGKNQMGIMLVGSKKTKNNMASQCEGAFRRIELVAEMQDPTWKMIRDLPEQPSDKQGDWLEAVIAAADHFKHGVPGVHIASKKIVLMTNFQNPTKLDGEDIEQVRIVFIRLEDNPKIVKQWQKCVKDPVTNKGSASEAIVREKVQVNTENQTVVEATEVIKGYNYGQQIIPFADYDQTMLYQSGEKCLSVYGFTYANNMTWQNLTGSSLYYIFGQKGNKKAQDAVECLVKCLHELNMVGIVRRVYARGNAPKMYAIMPVIDTNNFICLSMAAICYKDEIKSMAFPATNLKKFNCTDEQVNAFKDLIKAMDLMKAYDEYDEAEAFPIAQTVSPSAQYVLDCIAYRAMNPGKPLPQPRDEIMDLFKLPPAIEVRSRAPLEKLKKLFTLNEIEVKAKKPRKNDAQFDNLPMKPSDDPVPTTSTQTNGDSNMPKIQLPKKTDDVVSIGTVDPVSDFKALSDKGKTLEDLSSEMIEAIESLVYCNLDGTYAKALNTMRFFRTECVKSDPKHYNTWLRKFKMALVDRKKDDVLKLINEKQLNYILKEENNLSTYEENSNEDSQYYENDTIPNSVDLVIKPEENDMFDEM
ncbi:ku70/Ku80 beta-barrel domain-containing protein [Phthorimaea operculella]|nr:ku70/Ku80 beta-barrel domain-containing protein [Phthorimaea operculella]